MELKETLKEQLKIYANDLELIKLREQVIIALTIEEIKKVTYYDHSRDKVFVRGPSIEAHLHHVENIQQAEEICDRTGLKYKGMIEIPINETTKEIFEKQSTHIDFFRTEQVPIREELDIEEIYGR